MIAFKEFIVFIMVVINDIQLTFIVAFRVKLFHFLQISIVVNRSHKDSLELSHLVLGIYLELFD